MDNQFQNTKATEKIFNLKNRIRAVAGGTSASKTISILGAVYRPYKRKSGQPT